MQSQVNQGLQGNDNKKLQSGYIKSFELAESHKNQGLAKNFANPVQSGWGGWKRNFQPHNSLKFQNYFQSCGGLKTPAVTVGCHTL